MEFNEIESSGVIKRIICESVLPKIEFRIRELYADQVYSGVANTCLYIKHVLSYKIFFFSLKRIKKELLLEVKGYYDDTDSLRIDVWIMDGIIYPIVKDEFKKFGKEHENSISKINIIKDYV